jgi:hypothetical protein
MAVRASDGALSNLLSDLFPRGSIANHARDIGHFVAKVVEVKKSNVLFAAVDARMPREVLVNPRGQRLAYESAVTLHSLCVRDACEVPGSRGGALTRKANPVSRSFGTRPKRELGEGFGLPADATDSGRRIGDPQLLWAHKSPLARRLLLDVSQRRSEPMAVCAANFTLRYLFLDRGPNPTATEHAGDVALLVGEMIELQDDDVRFAAVNARMSPKVLDHPTLVVSPSRRGVPKQPRLLRLAILPVVLAPISGEALPTPRLQLRLAASHRRKLV